MTFQFTSRRVPNRAMAGFTLLEFLVAMGLFLVVGGAAFSLFGSHAQYFNRQQNLAGVNIQMQNALAQLQLDVVNAGTGYLPGSVIPSFPIGVTIVNQNPAVACNDAATYTYGATCFDTLNVLTINPNVPVLNPTDNTGQATPSVNCSQTTTGTFYIQPAGGKTAAQTAAYFNQGDQVILVTNPVGKQTTGSLINTFKINGTPGSATNATTNLSYVTLPFAPSNADGTNCNPTYPCTLGDPRDPLAISTNPSAKLGTSFCAQDLVMKLQPTTYSVSVTNPSDPVLQRTRNGTTDDIADQVIGFKIGATIWSSVNDPTIETYHFDPSVTGYNYDFSKVQSLRVILLGRTNPNPDPTYTFRNAFDGGPYEVVGSTVVVNPRNLSMNSQ